MNAILTLSLVIYCGFHVSAQRCCTPKKWSGQEGYLVGIAGGRSEGGTVDVAYDAVSQKVRANVKGYIYDGKIINFQVDVLQDFRKGLQYVITENECTITRLGQFKEMCIPDDAKLTNSSYFGVSGGSHLDVNNYQLYVKNKEMELIDYITMTSDGCVPVGETMQGSVKGVGLMVSAGFQGIKAKVNPKDFVPPAICGRSLNTGRIRSSHDLKLDHNSQFSLIGRYITSGLSVPERKDQPDWKLYFKRFSA